MNIKKKLDGKHVLLIKISSKNYTKTTIEIAKQLSEESLCYVTTNKTYNALEESFKKKGVNTENVFFVDTITGSIKNTPEDKENVSFISSPSALTEISLAISKFLKKDFTYLVFDSITNLLTYHRRVTVEKFMSNTINRVNQYNTRAAFYVLKTTEQEELISKCSTFVDEVLDIGGE